jgi:exopolysaccharide production protein ExoZ
VTSLLAAPADVSAERPARRRLDFVDALRGLACLWVLLHHAFEHMPTTGRLVDLPLDVLVHVSRIGWLGVSLFLVLSGFCLYYPVVRDQGVTGAQLDLKTFIRRRAVRILPPYFAALTIFSVVAWWWRDFGGEPIGWKDVIAHALMLHNLLPSTFASINPAFWSLALEVQLYLVFPLLVWLAARWGMRAVLLATLVISVATQWLAFQRFGLALQWGADLAVAYHSLPARCFEFVLGMLAAALVAHPRVGQERIAVALAALLALPALWFVLFVSRFGPLCDSVSGVIFASGVVILAKLDGARFTSRLSLRWLVQLGAVSYSVYLIHQPLMHLLSPTAFGLTDLSRLGLILFGAGQIALLIAVGAGFYFLLERPFIIRPVPRVSAVPPKLTPV